MELAIVQSGNPILRQQARPLTVEEIVNKETQSLIQAMRRIMHDAPGVGLAAPQLGLPIQLAVIEDSEDYYKDVSQEQLRERERNPVPFHVIINPNILEMSDEKAEFFEGCLSLTGFAAIVPRARHVRVEFLNERGKKEVVEASGWYARILQHEIDHLRGTLYIDRMYSHTFTNLENSTRFWKGSSIQSVKSALGL